MFRVYGVYRVYRGCRVYGDPTYKEALEGGMVRMFQSVCMCIYVYACVYRVCGVCRVCRVYRVCRVCGVPTYKEALEGGMVCVHVPKSTFQRIYMCTYVCMYVCVYVCMYVCIMYVCM